MSSDVKISLTESVVKKLQTTKNGCPFTLIKTFLNDNGFDFYKSSRENLSLKAKVLIKI
jgi:hypothetical protein